MKSNAYPLLQKIPYDLYGLPPFLEGNLEEIMQWEILSDLLTYKKTSCWYVKEGTICAGKNLSSNKCFIFINTIIYMIYFNDLSSSIQYFYKHLWSRNRSRVGQLVIKAAYFAAVQLLHQIKHVLSVFLRLRFF